MHTLNSHLILADYNRTYPMAVRGEGIYVYDETGRDYIDGSGCTAAVTHLGHGDTVIAEAVAEQARTLATHPTHLFHSPIVEQYFERLLEFAPDGFSRAWTISGGTEAVENAIKLAYQYHRAKGRQGRKRVIGRWSSYHGNSILTLNVGGLVSRRNYYTELMADQHIHVSPCLPYRRPAEQSIQQYEDGLVEEFAKAVAEHPDEIAAFIAEPVVGSALGAGVPTQNYFARIAEVCRAHDIVMIADEVMTGFGRTGRNFGCEHFGTHADILTCAKGISGGYVPLGAILVRDHIAQTLRESGDPFFSGQTYSCIPLAAATGLAVLNRIEELGLVQNAAEVGAYLLEQLQTQLDLPVVGEVRGLGLFLGVEFVADRQTKAIIPPEQMFFKRVQNACLEAGVTVMAARGTVDSRMGDHLLIAPPLIMNRADADELTHRLATGIRAAAATL